MCSRILLPETCNERAKKKKKTISQIAQKCLKGREIFTSQNFQAKLMLLQANIRDYLITTSLIVETV